MSLGQRSGEFPRSDRDPAALCYHNVLRIGIHTSIAGSLENAVRRAAALGANTFQIFTASPRAWSLAPLDPEAVRSFRRARERQDLTPLVVHDNYLINLASADPDLRRRSIAAFREEIRRSVAIGADYLVAHPGHYGRRSREEGLGMVAESLLEATRGLRGAGLTLLLENTAGSGASLGASFEELAYLRRQIAGRLEFPVGFCLDTAHCLAAGYDVATAAGLRATSGEIRRVLGWENVRLIHANDSRAALGSRRDRHEHIGEGCIGRAGFRRMLAHPRWRRLPFILETPRESDDDDRRNLRTLKDLCRRRTTTRRVSK